MLQLQKDRFLLCHAASIALLLAAIFVCFFSALNSLFLFDDIPNLDALAHIKNEALFSSGFWEFVSSGNAGPTGRPVSLFTFALQAESWPDNPGAFKFINLILHCLNALLVYLICIQLCILLKLTKATAWKIALFTSLLWATHPIHTSTVLYAIQRMALLSNFFILSGISIYLQFRTSDSSKNQTRPLIILSLALIITGMLSLFSKENAPSLIFYLLVLEYTLLKDLPVSSLFKKWRVAFLWTPAVLTILLPLLFIAELQKDFSSAFEYTITDRLMTESRILWQYLYIVLFPDNSGTSLFHDINISTSLFNPVTTLFSIIAWLLLLAFGIILRDKHRVLLFSILWFLSAHLIESTILPLELFFNHRNYLAFLGILFAAFYSLFILIPATLISNSVKISLPVLYGVILVFQTASISKLWNDPLILSESWYSADPTTVRNAEFHAINLANRDIEGKFQAAQIYDKALAQNKTDFRLLLNRMNLSCSTSFIPRPEDDLILATLALTNNENRDLISPLQQLVTLTTTNACNIYSPELLSLIITTLIPNFPVQTQSLYIFELSRLKFYTEDLDEGIQLLRSSFELGGDPGVLFTLALRFINAGRYEEALEIINQAITTLETFNNIRSGTRATKQAILYEMRNDVLTFMASENDSAE